MLLQGISTCLLRDNLGLLCAKIGCFARFVCMVAVNGVNSNRPKELLKSTLQKRLPRYYRYAMIIEKTACTEKEGLSWDI